MNDVCMNEVCTTIQVTWHRRDGKDDKRTKKMRYVEKTFDPAKPF